MFVDVQQSDTTMVSAISHSNGTTQTIAPDIHSVHSGRNAQRVRIINTQHTARCQNVIKWYASFRCSYISNYYAPVLGARSVFRRQHISGGPKNRNASLCWLFMERAIQYNAFVFNFPTHFSWNCNNISTRVLFNWKYASQFSLSAYPLRDNDDCSHSSTVSSDKLCRVYKVLCRTTCVWHIWRNIRASGWNACDAHSADSYPIH